MGERGRRFELRAPTEEELKQLEKLSRAQTAQHWLVERAKMVLWARAGETITAIAKRSGHTNDTVSRWLHRFNEAGIAGLEDRRRGGRPLTYSEEARGQMVATAKTKPEVLKQPFGHWTLDRLVAYVNDVLGISISRSQLGEVLRQEGIRWYQEKTYFTQRPDPEFAEKRGRL